MADYRDLMAARREVEDAIREAVETSTEGDKTTSNVLAQIAVVRSIQLISTSIEYAVDQLRR